MSRTAPKALTLYHARDVDALPELRRLSASQRFAIKVVAQVLPFRANNYVVEELIDWDDVPNDPIYRLTFPCEEMLPREDFARLTALMEGRAGKAAIDSVVTDIRSSLNPHPAGQCDWNVPRLDDEVVPGLQHKYRETVLLFPAVAQTCHAYCTFCFRWPQFVETKSLKFATHQAGTFWDYIAASPEVTDVLITGGDPLIAAYRVLAPYIEPFLQPRFDHVTTLRIGTKSLSYWPYRFVTDPDADDLLRLFERVAAAGKHLAFMAHFEQHGS